ncbi:MAG: hypothetical protein WBW85_16300 [Terriglobales bacterium]
MGRFQTYFDNHDAKERSPSESDLGASLATQKFARDGYLRSCGCGRLRTTFGKCGHRAVSKNYQIRFASLIGRLNLKEMVSAVGIEPTTY